MLHSVGGTMSFIIGMHHTKCPVLVIYPNCLGIQYNTFGYSFISVSSVALYTDCTYNIQLYMVRVYG